MADVARRERTRLRSRAGAAVALSSGLHLVIGLVYLGRLDLWYDEGFSAETVRLPVRGLLSLLTHVDVNMSVYYAFIKLWTALFGASAFSLRLPSLLMSTATVFLVGYLLNRWFGSVAGMTGSLALGLSPLFLTVGVTARSYAMLALVSTVALLFLVRALGSTHLMPWGLLALVDVVSLYVSAIAVLTILAQGVYVLFVDRRFRKGQLLAAALLCVGVAPMILFMPKSDPLSWSTLPTVRQAVATVYGAVGWRTGIAVTLLALVGVGLRPRPVDQSLQAHPRSRWLLPTFVVVPLVVMFALLPWQSLFTARYFTTFVVALTMLAGATLGSLRPRWAAGVAVVVLVSALAGVVLRFSPQPGFIRQDWRAATAVLDQRVRPGDAVVFTNPFFRVVGEYYGRSGRFMSVASPRLPSYQWYSQPPYAYDALYRSDQYHDAMAVERGLRGVDRVWLVGDGTDLQFDTSALTSSGWQVVHTYGVPGLEMRLITRAPS